MPTRRQFMGSVGAGLLLAPFINAGLQSKANAAGVTSKRLLLFCTMGTYPPLWTPTVSGETISAWSAMTQPLSAAADDIVLVEGMPSGNPNDNHGSSDSLTGQGFGYYAVNNVPVVSSKITTWWEAWPAVKAAWNRRSPTVNAAPSAKTSTWLSGTPAISPQRRSISSP